MRHLLYLAYLMKHKSRVFLHCVRLGVPIRGVVHDISKFSRIDWLGIGRQFYPSDESEKNDNTVLFQSAKEHHRVRNEHEVDHWYDAEEDPHAIPETVLREVVADWAAFQGVSCSGKQIRELAARSYQSWWPAPQNLIQML